MLSEKDKSVISSYASCGMSLETLIKSFPSFSKEDIEAAFKEYKNNNDSSGNESNVGISINCS